jgi:hypothetical protein
VKTGLQIEKHILICSSHINKNLLEGCLFVCLFARRYGHHGCDDL